MDILGFQREILYVGGPHACPHVFVVCRVPVANTPGYTAACSLIVKH
jgi:hypothetical protein